MSLAFRVLLAIAVVWALWRVLRGALDGAGVLQRGRGAAPAVKLVRDPICGTFVVPSSALALGTGADTRFFCSEKCLRAYQVKFAP